MAGVNNCGGPQTELELLKAEKQKLLRRMFSGVSEVENPLLGRTAWRTMDEMQKLLALLDSLIAKAEGANGSSGRGVRHAFYPVVSER